MKRARTRPRVPLGSFTDPTALFANGEQGGWYDPSDISTLWQDTAGTTPVTTLGQSVARIDDKSGRGNHLTQGTAASRPTWNQDSSGAYYLNFDGSNDFLTIATFNMSASDKVAVCAGVRKTSDASAGVIVELGPSVVSNNGTFGLFGPYSTATPDYGAVIRGTAQTAQGYTSYAAGTPHVVVYSGDLSAASNAAATVGTINGFPPGATSTAGTGAPGGGNFGAAYALFVGRRNGASVPLNGRIYGLIVCGAAITTQQRNQLTRYMAQKTGIAI